MDSDAAFWYLREMEDDVTAQICADWAACKGTRKAQPWKVLPFEMVQKEYRFTVATGGLVHDEVIQTMQDLCVENYLRIAVNTIIMGHERMSAYDHLEGFLPDDWDEDICEEWLEGFEDYAIDEHHNWRISDYGLDKLYKYVIALLEEEDYAKKLVWIDCIFNVTHQRSDLSSWFVSGGLAGLDSLQVDMYQIS